MSSDNNEAAAAPAAEGYAEGVPADAGKCEVWAVVSLWMVLVYVLAGGALGLEEGVIDSSRRLFASIIMAQLLYYRLSFDSLPLCKQWLIDFCKFVLIPRLVHMFLVPRVQFRCIYRR